MGQNPKIILVGLPGCGKTTFGRQLASKLELKFLDLDYLIEEKYAHKIPDIFAVYGEEVFREWETETLKENLSREGGFVLSSGGGCPCFNENMKLINDSAISVYLDVPLEEIAARIFSSKHQNRPMFKGMNRDEILAKLESLKMAREIYYKQAKIKLSGGEFSAELLVSELTKQIRNLS